MPDEIKFPVDYDSCPNCGSKRRLAEGIMNQEKEKGKVGKDARAAALMFKAVIADPRKPILSVPILMWFADICADCGTVYCIHAEQLMGKPGMPPQGGPNIRGLGFPQGDPRLS